MAEGTAQDVVFLGFGKTFDTISNSIILEELAVHGLEGALFAGLKTGQRVGPREWW